MLVLLIHRWESTSAISTQPEKSKPWESLVKTRLGGEDVLAAACLFEESNAGGNWESPQLYPDRAQNKRTDPAPDGIERAEPTLAPSRHRLTSELAKSRFRQIERDLKEGPTVATTLGAGFTSSL
jgi:hypothetical protein